jgi:hypothetical protein
MILMNIMLNAFLNQVKIINFLFIQIDFNYTYCSRESVLFPNKEEKILIKSKRKNPNPKKINIKKFTNDSNLNILENNEKILKNFGSPYFNEKEKEIQKEMQESKNKKSDFKENVLKTSFNIGNLQRNKLLNKNLCFNKENFKFKNYEKNENRKESPLSKDQNQNQNQNQKNIDNNKLKNYFNKIRSKKKESFRKENSSNLNSYSDKEKSSEKIPYNLNKPISFEEKKLQENKNKNQNSNQNTHLNKNEYTNNKLNYKQENYIYNNKDKNSQGKFN